MSVLSLSLGIGAGNGRDGGGALGKFCAAPTWINPSQRDTLVVDRRAAREVRRT